MGTDLFGAIDLLLARGADPVHEARVRGFKAEFERRTGAFTPEDPWFEARSGAFWDDALAGGFGRAVADEVPEGARAWVGPIERAHRGLWRVRRDHGRFAVVCAISGVELELDAPAPNLADALAGAEGYVDARVAGAPAPRTVAMLPGAVFHPAFATEAIAALLPLARKGGLSRLDTLDALLRMERALQAMSRGKPALAYRPEALKKPR